MQNQRQDWILFPCEVCFTRDRFPVQFINEYPLPQSTKSFRVLLNSACILPIVETPEIGLYFRVNNITERHAQIAFNSFFAECDFYLEDHVKRYNQRPFYPDNLFLYRYDKVPNYPRRVFFYTDFPEEMINGSDNYYKFHCFVLLTMSEFNTLFPPESPLAMSLCRSESDLNKERGIFFREMKGYRDASVPKASLDTMIAGQRWVLTYSEAYHVFKQGLATIAKQDEICGIPPSTVPSITESTK